MFDSLMPGARPRRLWLAIVVIGAITLVGLFVMFGVMWHDAPPRHPPKKPWPFSRAPGLHRSSV